MAKTRPGKESSADRIPRFDLTFFAPGLFLTWSHESTAKRPRATNSTRRGARRQG